MAVPDAGPGSPAHPGCWTWPLFWSLLITSLATQAMIYGVITSKPVIRSDSVGYYMYLPAALIHHDLTLATLEQREFPDGIPGVRVNRFEGHQVIKYPVGEALLLLPFFLPAWGVAAATGVTSVFGWPYQLAAAVAGAFYFALGGSLTWALLREKFDRGIALTALGLTILGTNLFHYATYDAGFSHVYSFCLAAGLLLTSVRLPASAGVRPWLALGLTTGLLVVTRPTNAVLVLFPLGCWFTTTGSLASGLGRLRAKRGFLLAALVAAALPVTVQLAYWKCASGHWLIYSYGREGFNFLQPVIGKVLFSVEKGWFVYIPLAFVAVGGWLAARGKLAPYFPTIILFAGLNVWVIASWHDWGYGGSFATRPLVESSPLFALGLAGALWRTQDHRWGRRILLGFAAACVIYTSLLMLGYWMRALPYIMATPADIQNCLTLSWLRK